MRAQFNRTGSSTYHLRLHPNVLPAVVIDVPSNQGTLLQSGRGVIFASVDVGWWSSHIQNLLASADPTHLPVYLSNNVLLFEGKDPLNCCIIGYHGTKAAGNGGGSNNSNGNAKVQTFAWASWVHRAFTRDRTAATVWALQDIHALSHEIAEWADDPFVNNLVQPWLTPTAPQYGCTDILETGDPVVGIGFAMGTNTFQQGPNPNGSQSADGYYHPEDEALLPGSCDKLRTAFGAYAVAVAENWPLHADGRPQSVPRIPPARDRLQLGVVEAAISCKGGPPRAGLFFLTLE